MIFLKKNIPIYFWQNNISPHVCFLADEFAKLGYKIIYVANEKLKIERRELGWQVYSFKFAELKLLTTELEVLDFINKIPKKSIHICQGFKKNILIGYPLKKLISRGIKPWVIMETINLSGLRGQFKEIYYKMILKRFNESISGIFLIGKNSKNLLNNNFFPFSYFLNFPTYDLKKNIVFRDIFKFIYVGRLDDNKNVDIIIKALSPLLKFNFELIIIGDGELKDELIKLAAKLTPNKVKFIGKVNISDVSSHIMNSDCLILPSKHDGFGAVAVESLMVGTPVICSSSCGVIEVIKSSGACDIFQVGNCKELTKKLFIKLQNGQINIHNRIKISEWAKCLNAKSGAQYLEKILINPCKKTVPPPWQQT